MRDVINVKWNNMTADQHQLNNKNKIKYPLAEDIRVAGVL